MHSPIYHIKRIERPPGLSGYCPAVWCAVCGTAANAKNPYVTCIVNDCPNVCHQRCLLESTDFNCEFTEDLRIRNGKPLSVTFRSEDPPLSSTGVQPDVNILTSISTTTDVLNTSVVEVTDEEGNIDHLSTDELKKYIKSLKTELTWTQVRTKYKLCFAATFL